MSWFSNLFNSLVKAFKRFLAVALPLAKQIIIAQLKDFAITTVNKLSATNLTDEAKRKQAFNEIKDEAKRRGIEVKDSMINLIIEIAVQYLKG